MIAARLAAAPVIAGYALGRAVVNVATTYAQPAPEPAPYRPQLSPPRVAVHGFCHQDVVLDVYTGWTGTVIHSRVISADGADVAHVRWSNSLASTPLRDVAARLVVTRRRGYPAAA